MPMPSFLSSIADKAQTAIQASPLAGHLPGGHGPRPNSPDAAPQPAANQAAAQGGQRSHALEALSHQFRTLQQQYSSATTPTQKIITTSKGFALDLDSTSRDVKAQSKELYTWGQQEPEDLKDVTDRLAYLNFVHGSLASTLSQKLEASRGPWKILRDAEASIQPRRSAKALLEKELVKVENDPKKGGDIREQLRKAELENDQAEKEVELLKRKAVKESEQIKWEAIREYAEKLVLLSQAATPIMGALPVLPPDASTPYTGASATAAARASLQRALDNYKTGHINLPPAGADLSRSDTRSFGESHAEELSTMGTYSPAHPHHSPTHAMPIPQPVQHPTPHGIQLQQPVPHPVPAPAFPTPQGQMGSPPINPTSLNQAPAPLPAAATTPPAPSVPDMTTSSDAVPIITPTVAETGIPVAAGSPGPAKGSLNDLKNSPASPLHNPAQNLPPPSSFPTPPASSSMGFGSPRHETAEEEKKRLEREERERILHANTHETAEEEKKRLEREERERILRNNSVRKDNNGLDEDLPPYQEPQ